MATAADEKREGTSRRRAAIYLIGVLLLAMAVRVGFASLVVSQHTPASFADIHGDTAGYVRIGERMFQREEYTAGSGYWRMRGLVRPPGYPAFYAACRAAYAVGGVDLNADLRPIVWPQVAASLAQVAATFVIARIALRSLVAATIAGLIASCSPTGVATAAIAMADAPFAACFAIAFVALLQTTRGRASPAVVSFGGSSLALAALLKPAAIYWPIVALPAIVVAAIDRRQPWRATLVDARRFLLPVAIAVVVWTTFNGWKEGVRAYSVVSARNLRYEVVPKVELTAALHRSPTDREVFDRTLRTTRRDESDARVNGADLRRIYRRMTSETRAVFDAHPRETFRVLSDNLVSAVTSQYKLIRRQLPDGKPFVPYWIRTLADRTDGPWALAAWYGPMLLAPLLFLRDRRTLAMLVLCWLAVDYVALPTASVAGEGSRLQLAAEPMAITLIVACGVGVMRHLLTRRRRARIAGAPMSTLSDAGSGASATATPRTPFANV